MNKWHNCYDDSWQGIITPESFSHPAKMSRGLTNRIFKHALSESWIKPGDVVVDPFGGIGSTGIVGAYLGIDVLCCELEMKFCKLAMENFNLHGPKLKRLGLPRPQIIQGDSRRLSEVFAGADCLISSPPFLETGVGGSDNVVNKNKQCVSKNRPAEIARGEKAHDLSYGQTPGQLGAMKPGSVDAVVSSPPYAESLNSDKCGIDFTKAKKDYPGRVMHEKRVAMHKKRHDEMKYGKTPGNLGNLKPGEVDSIISSPPWENQEGSMQSKKFKDGTAKMLSDRNAEGKTKGHYATPAARKRAMDKANQQSYGESPGQLGIDKGETFWAAAKQIVSECHKILKPGGHAIWVVKAFVRKGAIVDFPGDWRRLCEAVGFQTVHEHHAMLVKETRHVGLFGTITEIKERKSFFRRLAEKKGSPKIDYEVVLCMRKL